ncbi:DUF2442 domain-containing protein [Chlorobaculum thiosulfatiphilum]|uniref:DUF2442 domain-containing protein n=1 Tax=Chlorobaculum thiosulfatiphilum TaxID=115852 RepID=A0A5C4S1Z1_CHLTI|nr:DUF2442 domain-containing protein [Chlorobaculum thiosulfatiphilum]TNJ37147.1 DUF2442 domain-containing protein [Chlorobaculum thiosulfatiphilum]
MDTIVKALPLDDHKIEIVTSSGIEGIFDVKPYLKGSAFKELEDQSYFRLVRPAHRGIMWPNEQDFSSDTIIWDIKHSQQSSALCPDSGDAAG